MAAKRYLIVNADDFGLSSGVNQGIVEAHERGIVTSASLMVRWPAAAEAAAYGQEHPNVGVGLHVDLGEWSYRDGTWIPLYEVVQVDDMTAVAEEVSRQLDTFSALLGRKPTHMDSHQHVHLREPVRSILVEIARRLSIPLRHVSPKVRYCGEFYGQTAEGSPLPDAINVDALLRILSALSPGFTELACHPANGDDLNTMYRSERVRELKALCDPRVRTALASMEITLRSFRDLSIHGEEARA